MDLTPNSIHTTTTTTTTTTTKGQEAESETPSPHPPPTQLSKPATDHHTPKSLSFTNGVLKRRCHHPRPSSPVLPLPVPFIYKECQKNHAASLGGHALDGCGEFMPSPSSTPTDPTSLRCAACGCHRNFHRREPEEVTLSLDFHHHAPTPAPTACGRSPNSPSPPPLSSSYFPSAPHMLLALSTALSSPSDNNHQVAAAAAAAAAAMTTVTTANPNGRKRFRTKFSQDQKEKMLAFSERLNWKMQKRDEELVDEFCNEVGVGKGVLKVWMHNNKHVFAKRDNANNNISNSPQVATTNGSSSSS